jgi:hypothetical protein
MVASLEVGNPDVTQSLPKNANLSSEHPVTPQKLPVAACLSLSSVRVLTCSRVRKVSAIHSPASTYKFTIDKYQDLLYDGSCYLERSSLIPPAHASLQNQQPEPSSLRRLSARRLPRHGRGGFLLCGYRGAALLEPAICGN